MTTNPPKLPQADQAKAPSAEKSFKWLIILLAIVAGCLLAFYFLNFHGGIGDKGDFGAFGDYFGGVLNPILGFATVSLLVWSLKYQMDELALSRQELALTRQELAETKEETALSRKAVEAQVEHLKKEAQLNELRQILAIQIEFIDKCLSTKVHGEYIGFSSAGNYIEFTLSDFLNESGNISTDSNIYFKKQLSASTPNPILNNMEELKQYLYQYSVLALEYKQASSEVIFAFPYLTKAITLIYTLSKFSHSQELEIFKEEINRTLKPNVEDPESST